MHRGLRLLAAVALLLPTGVGCLSGGGEAPERVQDWREARAENQPFGEPATTARLVGPSLTVTGQLGPTTLLPDTIEPPSRSLSGPPFLFVEEATLSDGRTGLLALQSEELTVLDGRLEGVSISEVETGDTVHVRSSADRARLAPGDVPDWPEASAALDRAGEWAATPDALRLGNVTRAVLIDGNQTHELEGPVEVSGGTPWVEGSPELTTSSLEVRADSFRVSGEADGGRAELETGASVASPDVLAGNADRIRVTPGSFETTKNARLTQVVADGEPLLDAGLELYTPRTSVEVTGEETWVTVWYRETTYGGDALVQDVDATGAPENLTTLPLEDTGGLGLGPEILLTGPAAPFLVAAAGLAEAFSSTPQPLSPWIDAGEVGSFTLVLQPQVDPGTYVLKLTLDGNFPDASQQLEVTVPSPDEADEDPPSSGNGS